jgi:DNA-binding transcriptional MerR regulator
MVELNGEHYLDGHEASTLLGIKLSTLYTYVSRGVLKSYKQGIKRKRLYKLAELESLLFLHASRDSLAEASEASASSPSSGPSSTPGSIRQTIELPYAEEWVPDI